MSSATAKLAWEEVSTYQASLQRKRALRSISQSHSSIVLHFYANAFVLMPHRTSAVVSLLRTKR